MYVPDHFEKAHYTQNLNFPVNRPSEYPERKFRRI